MSEQIVIKRCNEQEEQKLRAYWQKKLPRIERLLKNYRPDQRHICLTIERGGGHYEGRLVIKLPTGDVAAKYTDKHVHSVIDEVVDTIVNEIKKHKEKVRRDDLYKRKTRRQQLDELIPTLLSQKEKKDKETFFSLLRPLLRQLEQSVRHEIVIAQLQGILSPGEVTVSDVMDEVLVKAWDEFENRPKEMPLENWVTQLMHHVLDSKIEGKSTELSVVEDLAAEDPRYTAEVGWVTENEPAWEEELAVSVDDLFPSEDALEPWQWLEAEELMRWLLSRLSTQPALQRRAFVLNVLEGLSEEEIAMLQGRHVQQVREDIKNARQLLWEQFQKLKRESEI